MQVIHMSNYCGEKNCYTRCGSTVARVGVVSNVLTKKIDRVNCPDCLNRFIIDCQSDIDKSQMRLNELNDKKIN